jgi:hypothetical protein
VRRVKVVHKRPVCKLLAVTPLLFASGRNLVPQVSEVIPTLQKLSLRDSAVPGGTRNRKAADKAGRACIAGKEACSMPPHNTRETIAQSGTENVAMDREAILQTRG